MLRERSPGHGNDAAMVGRDSVILFLSTYRGSDRFHLLNLMDCSYGLWLGLALGFVLGPELLLVSLRWSDFRRKYMKEK